MLNGINGLLFQQSLQDLVKGIRAHRREEEQYVRSKLVEIAEECRSSDLTKKTTAILKLTYLQMMGYSPSFASFHIVEVMSSPDFATKRIGYLAASQTFSPATDVLLLTTNQFKKDLTNGKVHNCSQALTCLGKIITEELGRDLETDISLLLTHSRPYIRKKALLVLYRLIMVHPDTLPVISARFRERLTDSDPAVLCAAVTVTTELARASPSTFLPFAPLLYQLLTNKDSNNWMLIKIVKLMGVLTPLEPRLGKKLLEPLTTLMRTTRAKSLLYECCSTVATGLLNHPEAVDLCATRLAEFMNESDQNLKYLGLLSMRKLLQAHPHLATDHRDNILDCLDDDDIGIRMRALELVSEFVTKRNLRDISRILLRKLKRTSMNGFFVDDSLSSDAPDTSSDGDRQGGSSPIDQEAPFREALARQLLQAGIYKRATTSFKGGYDMLSTADDFAWYCTTILAGLSEIPLLSTSVRMMLADQLIELTSRVEAVRGVSVKIAFSLLSLRCSKADQPDTSNGELSPPMTSEDGENPVNSLMPLTEASSTDMALPPTLAGSTAWILGEYAELIGDFQAASKRLVEYPKRGLDSAAQVRILTACVKVYVACSDEQASSVFDMVNAYVESLINSQFAEVQDRAWFFNALLKEFGPTSRRELSLLFDGKLIPVDPRAQSKVPVSAELDLDTPLLDLGTDSLYAYLKRSIGDGGEGVVDDDVDDEKDLFAEAVFANPVLGMSIGDLPSAVSSREAAPITSFTTPRGLGVQKRVESPFYLNGESGKGGRERRGTPSTTTGGDEESYDGGKYGLDGGPLGSEAAVVIAEENPLGLSLSDDDGAEATQSHLESRLQEAFHKSGEARRQYVATEKVKEKKSQKKKKKKKDEKSRRKVEFTVGETNLIDLGEDTSVSKGVTSGSTTGPQPKHVADTLLM